MTPLSLTQYQRKYRQAVMSLLAGSYQTHVHLDWYDTELWLERPDVPVRLAWQGDALMGIMGFSEALHEACWLRLLAVRDDAPTQTVLTALWTALEREARQLGVKSVSLLITHEWLRDYAPLFGMSHIETIVTLRRRKDDAEWVKPFAGEIRPAEHEDYETMTAVDQAAFAPPWQLSFADLRQAARIASLCTVAELDGRIVGYQLSTRHRETGHLARLAVLPEMQGYGIGGALVYHMIRAFHMRGVRVVTVNTQRSNERSQRLYYAYDFIRNGFDMPVYQVRF